MEYYTQLQFLSAEASLLNWFILMSILSLCVVLFSTHKHKPPVFKSIFILTPLSLIMILASSLSPIYILMIKETFGQLCYAVAWFMVFASLFGAYIIPANLGKKSKLTNAV
jgi:hypothetical protein